MITSAISSAVEASAFFTTSRVIGSTVVARTVSAIDVDLDVAVGIESRDTAGRDDAGRVDLVHEQRPAPLSGQQAGAAADRRLDQAVLGAEVRLPRALVRRERAYRRERVVAPRRSALDVGDSSDRD